MGLWEEIRRTAIAYGLVALVAGVLALGLTRFRVGRLWLTQRLRPGFWTGSTVLFHLFLFAITGVFARNILAGLDVFHLALPDDASLERQINLAGPLAFTLFMALSITSLYVANRTHVGRVGLSLFRWRTHALLGVLGFIVVTPIVLGIHAACLMVAPAEKHPLERLATESLQPFEWVFLFLQTVVFAPIIEEWLFRGLLQGWLRRTTLLGHAMLIWITVGLMALTTFASPTADQPAKGDGAKPAQAEHKQHPGPLYFAMVLATVYGLGVVVIYRPLLTKGLAFFGFVPMPQEDSTPAEIPRFDPWTNNLFIAESQETRLEPWKAFNERWPRWKQLNARWAIIGSSFVFALAHGTWPSPVPLFLLGLVLGWLTYRTQNLVPAMVLHALFNLVAFLVLWSSVYVSDNGNAEITAVPPPTVSGIVSVVPGS